MLLHSYLEESAARLPGKVALITEEGEFTYREVEAAASRLARTLAADGLCRGDRVAIFLDSSFAAVATIFAVFKAGGVLVMVSPTAKRDKLRFILHDCRAAACIGSFKKGSLIEEAGRGLTGLRKIYLDGEWPAGADPGGKAGESLPAVFAGGGGPEPLPGTIDIDLAAIIYTSGSTGVPKGVMMTHLSMTSAAHSISSYLEETEDDVILSTLPLSFDYGLYQPIMAFKTGATLVLEKSFSYPYRIVKTLLDRQVTGFPIVPTMSAILLQLDLRNHSFDHLRFISNTAAALPPSHIEKLRLAFPRTRIYSMYGLTECKRVAYLPPDQLAKRPGSVGKAMPNTEVFIVDEHGNELGPGQVGELVIRGANVMCGYWERPEETAARLRPGRYPGERLLYSGDLFTMDEEGYLYFVARKGEVFKSRGEKVSPVEIEKVLYELDGVVQTAVIGIPDPVLGHAIKAFVVPAAGSPLSADQVRRHCAARLEDYLVPQQVEFREDLPKTETGKLDKKALHGR
ncbi:MAG: AMP-binding protein [Desulfobacteraceae bacterium]|nr:AMP-binding protein [Desulfobacteraceae bacterium]